MAATSACLRLNGITECSNHKAVLSNGGATLNGSAASTSNGSCNGHVPWKTEQLNNDLARTKRISTRVYEAKQSPIDELIENDSNFKSLQIVISTQIVLFLVCNFFWDSLRAGRPYVNLHEITNRVGGFSDIGRFLLLESAILLCALAIHPFFKGWMKMRQYLPNFIADSFFSVLYLAAVVASFPAAMYSCDALSLPAFLSVTISVEQVRVCMKSYSFIRENAYKVLYPWHKDDKSGPAVWYAGQMSPTVGSFYQYCYYLFCPTLLYRDHYPRIAGPIRWQKAGLQLLNFITGFWCLYLAAMRVLMPDDLSYESIIKCVIYCMVYGLPSLLFAHLLSIHGWSNFTGELTRFADRKFYADWWSSTHFSEYYRKWNLLVHEYIHQYLYLDIKALIPIKQVRAFLSIALSALLHEYMISMGTGFFSPILIINFSVIGFIFFIWPVKHRLARTWLTIFALSVGEGFMSALYVIEVFSRKTCKDGSHDIIGLRMFDCILRSNP